MVSKEEYNGEMVYHCEVCNLHYHDKDLAKKCETCCRTNGACSDEVTAQSIERSG